jgi:hypothetical protein
VPHPSASRPGSARLGSGLRLRAAALLPLGALAVHQGRYALAFGHRSSAELAAQGHAYLTWVTPLSVILAAVAGAEVLGRLVTAACARAPRGLGEGARARRRLRATWLAAALVLLALYVVQESLEGVLATGHPGGLAGVLGQGGWLAVPLAVAVGGALAFLLRAPAVVDAWVARRRAWVARRRGELRAPAPRTPPRPAWRLEPLASKLAGRAPPAALIVL